MPEVVSRGEIDMFGKVGVNESEGYLCDLGEVCAGGVQEFISLFFFCGNRGGFGVCCVSGRCFV